MIPEMLGPAFAAADRRGDLLRIGDNLRDVHAYPLDLRGVLLGVESYDGDFVLLLRVREVASGYALHVGSIRRVRAANVLRLPRADSRTPIHAPCCPNDLSRRSHAYACRSWSIVDPATGRRPIDYVPTVGPWARI